MPKHLTSAVKPLKTFLSFKDFINNLLMSLSPSARSFFNFMTTCYFPCYMLLSFLVAREKYQAQYFTLLVTNKTFYVHEIRILAYKTMLWMFVVRTLAWCFPNIGNVKYPHGKTYQRQRFKSKHRKIENGKDCLTFHRTTAYHCCRSFFRSQKPMEMRTLKRTCT